MELKIKDKSGKDTAKKVSLVKDIYEISPNDHAIYLDVKQYLANQRQGTHKAKEKGEVNYSTKKIKKQKGTGGARAGSIKSPVFVGGGTAFGPRPRTYGFKLNKQLKQLARKSALTYKAKENNIMVVEDIKIDEPKTKDVFGLLTNLKLSDKNTLIVVAETDKNVYLSARNIKNTNVVTASELNTYGIMRAQNVILFESAVSKVESQLKTK